MFYRFKFSKARKESTPLHEYRLSKKHAKLPLIPFMKEFILVDFVPAALNLG